MTEQQFDVVVVGGGIGGLVTANRAAELGLRVVLLERGAGETYPCNARFSGGILHVAYRDPVAGPEAIRRAIDEQTAGAADPELADALAENAERTLRWIQAEGGRFVRITQVEWQRWMLAPPRRLVPGLDWEGRGPDFLLRTLSASLAKRGGRIERGTRAVSLTMSDGACTGVVAERDGAAHAYPGRCVVLADGGFQGDPELVRENIMRSPEKLRQRGAGTGVGDGLRMARDVGAASVGTDRFYGHILSRDSFDNDKLWPYPELDAIAAASVVVAGTGSRFADEGRGGIFLANEIARREDPLDSWLVFDDAVWQGPGKSHRIPANPLVRDCGGTVHVAESIAQLAARMGIPADALGATVDAYNRALRTGEGARLTPPRTGSAAPLDKPPFYGVPVCAGITYTMGGLAIDTAGRVLREDRSAIDGLYAVGSTTGGLEGGPAAGYVGGLMKAAVFGLLAAEDAVARCQTMQSPLQARVASAGRA